jgi:Sel1 repeat-containing protein
MRRAIAMGSGQASAKQDLRRNWWLSRGLSIQRPNLGQQNCPPQQIVLPNPDPPKKTTLFYIDLNEFISTIQEQCIWSVSVKFLFISVIFFLVACTTPEPPKTPTITQTYSTSFTNSAPYGVGWFVRYSEICSRYYLGGTTKEKIIAIEEWYGNDRFFLRGYSDATRRIAPDIAPKLDKCDKATSILEAEYAGRGILQSDEAAIEKIEVAAMAGDAVAQNDLGLIFTRGQKVPLDYQAARKWFTMAAEQGYAPAQNSLGNMYARTRVLPKNYEEGLKWYRRAADQGNIAAQFNLGRMYYYGRAVELDYERSLMWYSLAAEQGHVEAAINKRRLEKKISAESIEKAQALVNDCIEKGFSDC